jgi:hypothetical protein
MSEQTTNIPVLGRKFAITSGHSQGPTTFVLQKFRYIPDPATPAILGWKWREQCESVGWIFPSSLQSDDPKDGPEHLLSIM